MKRNLRNILLLLIALIAINVVATKFYNRFDLTKDKRYTLSETTNAILENLDGTVVITVYLEGDFPAEFKRLQIETQQHLEELGALNKYIKFIFSDPLDKADALINEGLEPSRLSVQEGGKVSEAVIFPWATVTYKDKKEYVSLLVSQTKGSQEEQLQASIENLEYAFSDALHKVTQQEKQKIAILKGNGELEDQYLAGFLLKLRNYYTLAPFTMDAVSSQPEKTMDQLSTFDLAIIAKPTERFTEEEKFALDQYIIHGGKTLWLLDNVTAELDSLMQNGQSVVLNKDLNLTDQLFSYGVRLNYAIIRDMYSSTIRLAAGNTGDRTQYQDFLWPYYPLITSQNEHAITKNTAPVLLRFANAIDTLKNNIQKTILLQSSEVSKAVGTPFIVHLDEVAQKPAPEDYNNGHQIIGVLLEGKFSSAYNNRVKPFKTAHYQEQSGSNKMIVIADGDIIANEVYQGQPLELGVDKWTNIRYGNSDFLMNAINYLLDDTGLLQLRSKTIQLQFLDKEKAYAERSYWQLLNIVAPLVLLSIFGVLYTFTRKRKYS